MLIVGACSIFTEADRKGYFIMLEKYRTIAGHLFTVAAAEVILFWISLFLLLKANTLFTQMSFPDDSVKAEFFTVCPRLMLFGIFVVICVLYMWIVRKETLKVFRFSTSGVLGGLAAGFIVNTVVSLGAVLGTGMKLSFSGITLYLIPVFIANTIQCAAEEVLLRGMVPEFMKDRYSWDVIAFVSGTLFIFHHIRNMLFYGFSPYFCLNVFLLGCLFVMSVRYTGNFWWALGFHTAWNFTQEFLLGLPNSGMSSTLAIFTAAGPHTNFFFDEVYGNEGSLLCTVICLLVILILWRVWKKKDALKLSSVGAAEEKK